MNGQQIADILNWIVPLSALIYSITLIYCHKHYSIWAKISLLAMPLGILIAYTLTYIDSNPADLYKILALRRFSVILLFLLHSALAITMKKEHFI